MKRLLLLAGLLACASVSACADDPPKPTPAPVATIAVNPPGPVNPGDLVTLDASASSGDSLLWDSDVPATLYRQDSNGKLIYFAAVQPGSYLFRLDSFAMANGKIAAGRAKVTITVRQVDPVPTPAPVAPPSTADPLGLTASTRSLLGAMSWPTESLRWRQTTLGPIFSDVAAKASTYLTSQSMIDDLETRYKAAIGPDLWPQWQAAFFKPLYGQLQALQATKRIANKADLTEAFTEISNALKGN